MDVLASIFEWLRAQEAGFSALAAIAVLAGILFTGLRLLVRRRPQPTSEPTTKVFQVTLTNGSSLAQIVADLNDAFKSQGVGVTASDEAGVLTIKTDEYGADMKLDVFSDRSGAGSTQIGTTTLSSTGVDVAGLIGGKVAEGLGNTLTVSGGDNAGLKMDYTGTTTGFIGTVNVVQGSASLFSSIAENLGEAEDGPISARDKAIQAEIETIDDRIAERQRLLELTERRVRAQFVALDATLGVLQIQGQQLLQSLGTLGFQSPEG